MNTLLTADLHLSDNPRDRYRLDFQKRLRSIVKKRNVSCTVILGDLTEKKDNHGAWLVNQIAKNIYELSRLCAVVLLKGNHDYVDEMHPFYEFLSTIVGVDYINEPKKDGGDLYLPHTTNPDAYSSIDGIFQNVDTIYTHATFTGALSETGARLEGWDPKVFGFADDVFSGDIHKPQRIEGTNVTYVGAPYTVDFGDDYSPRLILLDGMSKKSIKVGGPQKKLIHVKSLAGLFTGTNKEGINEKDILKVRVDVTPPQRADWRDTVKSVRDWGSNNGYQIYTVQPNYIDNEVHKTAKRAKHDGRSDRQLFNDYVASNNIDKITANVGRKIMKL